MKINQFATAEHTIREVLRMYPETRNDDKELTLKVWAIEGLELTPLQQQIFKKCMSTETIRRTRQKIQESGEFQPDAKVAHERHVRAEAARKYFSEGKKVVGYNFEGNTAIPIYE